VAYPMHEPWLDVGQPDDLASAIGSLQGRGAHTEKSEP
jgi:NDP-sugar pyrophosphorylase family protein